MDAQQRLAQLSPKQRALLERRLSQQRPATRPQLPARAWAGLEAPLSFAQERLWFLAEMDPQSGVYNLPVVVPLERGARPQTVEDTIRALVDRHSALRTRFVVSDGRPRQVVSSEATHGYDFATVDLGSGGHRGSQAQVVARLSREHVWAPFDLETGPLVRARLIRTAGDAVLLIVMHHIVSDGWSLNVFVREFRTLYDAARTGGQVMLPPAGQYADYAAWQRETLQGEKLERLVDYWRRQLAGAPALIELPHDRRRPPRQSFTGALHEFELPRPSTQRLTAVCRDTDTVPFMVLFSAFNVLLSRYTNQPRIVVGTPIANRTRSDLEGVIGFFTNTLALCTEVSEGMSFRELLGQVRTTTLGAYEHQELPFEQLVSELRPERSLSHNPVFQVMFSFQNTPADAVRAPEPSPTPLVDVPAKFDLSLALVETGGGYSAVFEYATDLFDAETVARMAGHFVTVVEHLLTHVDDDVTGFSLLSAAEERTVVHEFNDTARDWPAFQPLHGGFERWARETPTQPAVMFGDQQLSYAELDERAERVAASLRAGGVGTGDVVGICVRRSLEMVIGLIAILKAGAAYLPIDPDFPAERVGYLLDDANVGHVLATARTADCLGQHPAAVILLDRAGGTAPAAPANITAPHDAAYVIFTSGSTGEPKGVLVSHGAIHNRLRWMQERYALRSDDRVMQKTPLTFDVSVWEVFWPLSEGACLVVAEPERHKEPRYLVELIGRRQVTCLHFVPSMLDAFLAEDVASCRSLKRILCSGEAMSIEQCRRLHELPGVSSHNLYGPTEAAVDVTHWDCADWCEQYLSVPIGRPIANTQIHILDRHRQPVPIGVTGELYIGGANLAQGYLNKPELTARAFIANPFCDEPGSRLYRTGDLARYRRDGIIEYAGRTDAQLKLRGVRIEPGEIEYALRRHPAVSEAAVVIREFDEHDSRLVAYVVSEPEVDTVDVRASVARQLPSYMVPTIIVPLAELPLTPSGKLDRRRLPDPAMRPSAVTPTAPAGEVEEVLLAIWQRLLKVDRISTTDDFFALGGHSLLAFRVINSVNRHYEIGAPVRLLFENPTIASLATALGDADHEAWLEDARTAGSLLAQSTRRLAETVDELSEEQLDEILVRYRDCAPIGAEDDPSALLRWAREHPPHHVEHPPHHVEHPPARRAAPPAHHAAPPPGLSPYARYFPQLACAAMVLEHRRLDDDATTADTLPQQAEAIFAQFSAEMRDRLVTNGSGPPSPSSVAEWCREMIDVALVAERLGIGQEPER